MREKRVVEECVKKNKFCWRGHFKLSDGSSTQFEIRFEEDYNDVIWDQWGNTTDNLCITTDRVEQLTRDFTDELGR